jgi:hypothetical protein
MMEIARGHCRRFPSDRWDGRLETNQWPAMTLEKYHAATEREESKRLQSENVEFKRANEILRKRLHFSHRRSSPPERSNGRFIDHHRHTYGVEPICAVVPTAPSTYFLRKAQ